MTFQRARSQEQIERRQEDIIQASIELYDELGFEKLNFSAISKKTGLTRPTIYNYFKTKEEILIRVIIQEFRNWTAELLGEFKLNKIYDLKEISRIWAETLSHHPRFMKLYSILFTMLEVNCSVDTLAQFKIDMLELHLPLNNLITQLIPGLNSEDIYAFLLFQLSIAIGIYPMANISENQMEAIVISETGYQVPDFKSNYSKAIYQQLYCLKNKV